MKPYKLYIGPLAEVFNKSLHFVNEFHTFGEAVTSFNSFDIMHIGWAKIQYNDVTVVNLTVFKNIINHDQN